MSFMSLAADRESNPVDTIEQVAHFNDWMFERSGEHEISISVTGGESDYHISFSWMDNLETLHLACAFDFRVPETRLNEMYRLIAQINEQLWLGHFDLWTQEGLVMFRHALLLRGGQGVTSEQLDDLLDIAMSECNRFYPAFQSVLWGGNTVEQALEIALLDTVGEA